MTVTTVIALFFVTVAVGLLAKSGHQVQAATPSTLNFQARLQTNTGAIVPDGYYNIEFKLYNAASSSGSSQGSCTGDANCVWTETRYDSNGVTAGNDNRVRVKNGYLTVELGSITAFSGSIDWSQEHWITMRVGGSAQTATPTYDPEMSPRLKLTAVPYAFKAGDSATLGGIAASGFIQNGTSPQTASFSVTGSGVVGGNFTTDGAAINIGTSGVARTVQLGTGSTGTQTVYIGTTVTTGSTVDIMGGATGGVYLNTGTGGAIRLGELTTNATIVVGSGLGTTNISLRPGTGGVSIGANGIANTLQLGNTTGAVAQTINIGNNATASSTTTLTLGSTVGTSATTINSGSSGVSVNTNNLSVSGTYNSNTFTSSALTFGGGSATISTASGQALSVSSNNDLTLSAANTNAVLIGTVNSNTITLGTTTATSTITVGRSTTTNTINVGSGNTSTGNIQTINIGAGTPTGTGRAAIVIGNTNGNSSVDIRSGAFGINLTGATVVSGTFQGTSTIRSDGGFNFNGNAGLASLACTGGQLLQNATVAGGIITAGSCASGGAGVTTVGTIDSQTKSANGAVISGTSIYMQTADASNPGLVSTTSQTFAGAKTFNGAITASGGISGDGSGLTNLNASNLASGTVASGRVSGSYTGITGTGALAAGSIASGFGTIATANTITGTTINGTTGINSGAGAGTQRIDASGNLVNIGTISTSGDINTNTFNGTTLTFGSLAAASIQSANTYALTVDSGSTGALNLGTGASAKTITLGNSTGATSIILNAGTGGVSIGANGIANTLQLGNTTGAVAQTINIGNNATASSTTTLTIGSTIGSSTTNIRAGSGGVNVSGATNINVGGSGTTNIGTGSNTGQITIGSSGSNNLVIQADNAQLTALGLLTVNSIAVTNVTAAGNFTQNNTTTFTTGNGAASFRNSTIGIGDATTDRVTFTAQIQGGSPLVFQGTTDNSFTTTLALVDPTANNTITLPNQSGTVVTSSNVGSANQCLKSSGSATTAASYSACGTASTLQDVYDGSGATNPQITLTNANGGLKIRDGSTPVTGNLFQLQNTAGTATYFSVSATATTLQYSSGNNFALLDSSTGRLRLYEDTGTSPRYLELYYDAVNGQGVIAASSGTTRVGSGTGNVAIALTGTNDVMTASKTLGSLSGAYLLKDFSFTRTIVAGATALNGSVVSIESLSTSSGSNDSTNLLNLNQGNNNNTGNLITAAKAGSDRFRVDSNGSVVIASSQAYTGMGAVNVNSGAGGDLTLQAAAGQITNIRGASGVDIMRAQTNSSTTVFSLNSNGDALFKPATASVTAFEVQNTSGGTMIEADTSNGRIQVGSSVSNGTIVLLVLDSYNVATDPTGVTGAMYYSTVLQQFRCFRDGAWEPCSTRPIDRSYTFDDEFSSGSVTATANATGIGNANWTVSTVGTNACQNFLYNPTTGVTPSGNRFGILRMLSSATAGANQGCRLMQGNATGGGSTVVSAGQVIKASVAPGAATNIILRTGLDTNTTGSTRPTGAGVWWEADPSTNANWQYCYATGAAATCASSGVAIAANTIARLEIRVTATGTGTSAATFLINGSAFNVSSVTINSSTAVRPAISCSTGSTSAASQSCFVDYFMFRGDASAAR